jgi:hypothetical protein
MMNQRLARRTFLKGLGTAVALPALEGLLPAAAQAAPAAGERPLRMVFMFVPNGVNMEHWRPGPAGELGELPYILEPLKDLKHKMNVLSGLAHDKARANGDGPGDHARSASAFLTASQPYKTAGADIKVGVSVDQFAAQHLSLPTKFASLELGLERGAQAGNCDSGYSCAYSSAISWRTESTPVAKEVDPRQVFDRLFGNGQTPEMDESRAKRDRLRKSILDFVSDDAKRLQGQLSLKGQRKLDEYLSSIREIEKRVELASAAANEDRPTGAVRPTGIPREYNDHARLMLDMLALAFQSDLSRISTFMLANEGSNRPYRNLGISDGHHQISHHQRDPEKLEKIKNINRFHAEQLAYFVKKLDSFEEGEGTTVLDNTMVVYGCAIGDGNRHNHDDLPVLMLGGGGGTLKTGRHLIYPRETPMANLFLSMLDRMGTKAERFGDSTGRLDNLG